MRVFADKKTGAVAWRLRTDAYMSAGVMLGLLVVWVFAMVWPGEDVCRLDPAERAGRRAASENA
ncbi:MAG: hypothetical protein JW990_14050 [Thermoleophilia bacterium]|nr:hypothetical protein [Thermoleophilia bacterium]